MKLLKVYMKAKLQNHDLKSSQASNESFWIIGQPDVELIKLEAEKTEKNSSGQGGAMQTGSKEHALTSKHGKSDDTKLYQVEVKDFDYFNIKTGELESGDQNKIAMWLDTDYDGKSLFPKQVFVPMAGKNNGGWAKLAKTLKSEIDEELIEAYRGTQPLTFELGKHGQIAVKIVDYRGVEILRVVKSEE